MDITSPSSSLNMADRSIDVSSLDRPAILSRLQMVSFSKTNVAQLRNHLRKKLEIEHPIHTYLSGLKNEAIKDLCHRLSPHRKIKMLPRMKKFIAGQFFEKCLMAPLTSLKLFLKDGRFADQKEDSVQKFLNQLTPEYKESLFFAFSNN